MEWLSAALPEARADDASASGNHFGDSVQISVVGDANKIKKFRRIPIPG
jgi:hypothetical protein